MLIRGKVDYYIKSYFLIYLLFFFILCLGYFPVLVNEYGLGDDFDTLHSHLVKGTNWDLFIENLRPVYTLIADIPFAIVSNKLEDFWALRLIYLILLSFSCLISYKILSNIGIEKSHSFFLSILIGLSPASQGMISWGIMCFTPLGTFFAAFAFIFASQLESGIGLKRLVLYSFLTIVFLNISLSIYTVYAQFFWPFVLAELFKKYKNKEYFLLRKAIFYLGIFGFSAFIYVLYSKYLMPMIFEIRLSDRAEISQNFFYGFAHFLARPLRDSTNLIFLSYYGPFVRELIFDHLPSYLLAGCILAFSVYYNLRSLREKNSMDKIIFFLCCGFLLCFCLSSHLVLENHYYPYRVQYALYSACLLFTYFAFLEFCKNHTLIVNVSLAVFSFVAVLFCYQQLSELMVKPNKNEWEYVKEKVSTGINSNHRKFLVICPTDEMKRSKTTINGFGVSITMTPNNRLLQMTSLALYYEGKNFSEYEIVLSEKKIKSFNEEETTIIDMRVFY